MPKKVAFARFDPEVRVIPDGMSTWAEGEESLNATPWDVENADRLWRESYALATAMEEEEATAAAVGGPVEDYFNTKHASSNINAGSGDGLHRTPTPARPKPSQLTLRGYQATTVKSPPPLPPRPGTGYHPLQRKPVPQRSYTVPHPTPIQRIDSVQQSSFIRPSLQRTRTTSHQFSDFLAEHELGNEHTDLNGRRDTFHPFEVVARKVVRKASKMAKVAEEKYLEKRAGKY